MFDFERHLHVPFMLQIHVQLYTHVWLTCLLVCVEFLSSQAHLYIEE